MPFANSYHYWFFSICNKRTAFVLGVTKELLFFEVLENV